MPEPTRTWGHIPPPAGGAVHVANAVRSARPVAAPPPVTLPASADLRPDFAFLPPTDQGGLNSCTAQALGACVALLAKRATGRTAPPSPLFVYYNERVHDDDVNTKAAVLMTTGLEVVQSLGVCPEAAWPYDEAKYADVPPPAAFAEALTCRVARYEALAQDATALKQTLADGLPFVFGFAVYPAFKGTQIQKDGHLVMPAPGDFRLGGHAVVAVGYDDANNWFVCRNSFGPGWGTSGYFTMPYDYALSAQLAHDFWVIREVSA
ncbi:MAG TPA: C1 family peptidase [Urbifossiella sp.]|nr:C1 family peptidase [Urbifossiella sp.]